MHLPSQHTKITPVVSVMGLPPKNLYNKRFENMSIFRFGSHPYKLATLRVTIGLIITSCYRIKLIKIKGFVTSQKAFVARNKFPHVKVTRNTQKVGQAWYSVWPKMQRKNRTYFKTVCCI